jgi:DNA repair protein RadA/Sms
VAGGYRVNEPAADLAVAAALVSSLTGVALPDNSVYFGEISLSGTVRPVAQADARLKEAQKLGFGRASLCKGARKASSISGLELNEIEELRELVVQLAGRKKPQG